MVMGVASQCGGGRDCVAEKAAEVTVELSFRPLPRLFPSLKARPLFARPFFPRVMAVVGGAAVAAGDPPVSIDRVSSYPAPVMVFNPSVLNAGVGETVTVTNNDPEFAVAFEAMQGTFRHAATIPPRTQFAFVAATSGVWVMHATIGSVPPYTAVGSLVVSSLPPVGVGPSTLGGIVPGVPGVGMRVYSASDPANPLNHAWRRLGGEASLVRLRVHTYGNLAPALFIGWANTIPGVAGIENYPWAHDLVVEVTDASVRDVVAERLQSWPDVWFVEPDFRLWGSACTDGTPCGTTPTYMPWVDVMNLRPAWCEPVRTRVIFEDIGYAGACGAANVREVHVDGDANVCNYHGDMQVSVGVGARQGSCAGAGAGSPGSMYWSGDGDCPVRNGQSTPHWGPHAAIRLKESLLRDFNQGLIGKPGDIFCQGSSLTDESPTIWGNEAGIVQGAGYMNESQYGLYMNPAVTIADGRGNPRISCRGGRGMLCAAVVDSTFYYCNSGCSSVSLCGDCCNSSYAAPVISGMLSLGSGNAMQKLQALIRSCTRGGSSGYIDYREADGYGIPDACRYLDILKDLRAAGRTFRLDCPVTREYVTPGGSADWTQLSIDVSKEGGFEGNGVPWAVEWLKCFLIVQPPGGPEMRLSGGSSLISDSPLSPSRMNFYGIHLSREAFLASTRFYDVLGRVGYNWVHSATTFRP